MEICEDQMKIRRVLRDTVALLCKNSLLYSSKMKIEGLLGITLDDRIALLVPFNELISPPCREIESTQPSRTNNVSSKKGLDDVSNDEVMLQEDLSSMLGSFTKNLQSKTEICNTRTVAQDLSPGCDNSEPTVTSSVVAAPPCIKEELMSEFCIQDDIGDVCNRDSTSKVDSIPHSCSSFPTHEVTTEESSITAANVTLSIGAVNEASNKIRSQGDFICREGKILTSATSHKRSIVSHDVFQKAADEVYALSHCPQYLDSGNHHRNQRSYCCPSSSATQQDKAKIHFPGKSKWARRIFEHCVRDEDLLADVAQQVAVRREKDRIRKRRQRMKERMRLSFLEAGLALPPYLERGGCKFNPCES